MLLRHLALSVKDPEASARFYLEVLGLAAARRDEPYGVVLTDEAGLTLALLRGEPLPGDVIGRVHFGCELVTAEEVRTMRASLRDAGVPELEWWDEEGYVSVKVADPDGYPVELFWEPVGR